MNKTYFLYIFISYCVFFTSRTSIDRQKVDNYLQILQKKEYDALKEVLIYAGTTQENIQQYMKFYKDFKEKYANEVFSKKNPNFFHDPLLARSSKGNSNVLEETKKLLKICGLNPKSITIKHESVNNSFNATAYATYGKKLKTKNILLLNLNNALSSLSEGKVWPELYIAETYDRFNHTILHEIGHLLEGHWLINAILSDSFSINDDFLDKNQEFKKIWNKFVLRTEITADVCMYTKLDEEHLLDGLRTNHTIWTRGERNSNHHPSKYSTYKRLIKINKATWNIPLYKYIFFVQGISLLACFGRLALGIGLGLILDRYKWHIKNYLKNTNIMKSYFLQ